VARILRVAALLALTWFGFYQIGFELRLGNYGISLGDFDITSNRTDIEFVNSRHFPGQPLKVSGT
jgi:hypothetical protein